MFHAILYIHLLELIMDYLQIGETTNNPLIEIPKVIWFNDIIDEQLRKNENVLEPRRISASDKYPSDVGSLPSTN